MDLVLLSGQVSLMVATPGCGQLPLTMVQMRVVGGGEGGGRKHGLIGAGDNAPLLYIVASFPPLTAKYFCTSSFVANKLVVAQYPVRLRYNSCHVLTKHR